MTDDESNAVPAPRNILLKWRAGAIFISRCIGAERSREPENSNN
jgi:hypothetical protein